MTANRIVAGLLMVPAILAGTIAASPAHAQTTGTPNAEIPSVGVIPVGTQSDDPNAGQWFIADGVPGAAAPVKFTARITNPAQVPQTVKMYLADLDFTDDGTPAVADQSDDIGTWGTVTPGTLSIDAQKSVEVPFELRVPAGADPGDHVGVFVVEGQPQDPGSGQLFKIVKRVATRMYITVPGDARADLNIESVAVTPDSSFFPREVTVRVLIRNSGRIRLNTKVTVNGKPATGSELLLSNSVEPYLYTEKVPLWGGPRSYRVDVTTQVPSTSGPGRTGPARQARASKFFIPYVLILAVAVGLVFMFVVVRLLRRRRSKFSELQADLRRFEKLIAGRDGPADSEVETVADPALVIKQAIKQAGRSGDTETAERLRAKLADVEGAAPPEAEPEPEPEPVSEPEPVPVAAAKADAADPLAVALGLAPPLVVAAGEEQVGNDDSDDDDDDDAPLDLPMLGDLAEPAGFSPMAPTETAGPAVNRTQP